MKMNDVSVAVGTAVGIPIGAGLVIGIIFRCMLQRRHRKEEAQDADLENLVMEDIAVSVYESFKVEISSSSDASTINGNEAEYLETCKEKSAKMGLTPACRPQLDTNMGMLHTENKGTTYINVPILFSGEKMNYGKVRDPAESFMYPLTLMRKKTSSTCFDDELTLEHKQCQLPTTGLTE